MTEPTLDDFLAAGSELARVLRKALDHPGAVTRAQVRERLERFEALEREASRTPPRPVPSPEIIRALLGAPSTIEELVDATGLRAAHVDVADLKHRGLVQGRGEWRVGAYGREQEVLELTPAGLAAASRLLVRS